MLEKLREVATTLDYQSYYAEAAAIREAIERLKLENKKEDQFNDLVKNIKQLISESKINIDKMNTSELISQLEKLIPQENKTSVEIDEELLIKFKEQYDNGSSPHKMVIQNMMETMGLSQQQIKSVTG